MFLISSIKVKKGANAKGEPSGTKCLNIWLGFITQKKSCLPNHIGKAKNTVRHKWLVLVNTYGNKPKKFLIKINIIKVIK